MGRFKTLPIKYKFLITIIFIIFIVIWTFVGFVVGRKSVPVTKEKIRIGSLINEDNFPQVADFPNPINGMLYTAQEANAWKDRLPLAVIIENHTDARPQTGLGQAEVVYEALAEGGITRFLAIFLSQDTELGPVRSNRAYFLDWVSEYSAGYAHVGGSPEAQQLVHTYNIKDLDQFYIGAPTYERSSARPSPHNVYTSTQKLRGVAAIKGFNGPVVIDSWQFSDSQARLENRPDKFNLNLGFLGTWGYDVSWIYQKSTNTYLRVNGGGNHIDTVGNKQLETKNIIVQVVKVNPDPSGHGRIRIDTVSTGKAILFKDGVAVLGTWKKDSRTSRTRFYDDKGQEMPINRGSIWVEVVPDSSPISY
ncbi:MAG: hypothetical protein A2172_05420 [Candidatus Woykebacteria bacterium RBG_13_40_15]|uniref:Lipoprotein YerB n=1 Tax=Candidatus Woykebacteria bacterium RBG_13_40_15 TaxID=1802593 RepID=A0A1G1W844_9BACT|nr:MAG: hypothetical protein A2172_05420 [Candidatus Woykebacteria bacterium RBG_13_40_15]